MKWIRRLWTRRREKREAYWRRQVHNARVPYVIYQTQQMDDLDPQAIFIPEETPKWFN